MQLSKQCLGLQSMSLGGARQTIEYAYEYIQGPCVSTCQFTNLGAQANPYARTFPQQSYITTKSAAYAMLLLVLPLN